MTDARRRTPGRHRAAPRHRLGPVLLKAAAVLTTAGGIAAAVAAPTGASGRAGSVDERATEPQTAVSAPPATSVQRQTAFGVIGFTATPRPKPRPRPVVERPAPAAAARTERPASRSVSYARSGLAVERGLSRNAIAVLNAVRERFPELRDFGGVRPGDPGDHGAGRAVDVMTSSAQGDAVAAYLQGRAGELGISYIIWKQRRWAPGGSWVGMEDRGSVTANHYDHVHISVR